MRLLVDTNVFLDVIYQRALLGPISKEFFVQTRQNSDEIYVCASTLKDIAYFAHKQFHDNKKTNDLLIDLYSRVTKVIGIETDDTIEALYMDGDFEDNLIALTAETSMCDAIITNDKSHFKNAKVVLSPQEYLSYRNQ